MGGRLMATKRPWVPMLNTLEFLLQGRPDELLPIRAFDAPESDRAVHVRIAGNWVGNEHLRPEERARIQAVWIDSEQRPPLNVDRARREELRALIAPRRVRQERMDTEQLQAAMGGER